MAGLITRMMAEPDKRLLWKFVYNFGWKGMRSVTRFQKRLKRGEFFPAFMFVSLTNNCNLSCRGCWSSVTKPPKEISVDTLGRIIDESRKQGSYFFGILGGEPLLYKGLFDLIAKYPDCYFILFTNGTLMTDYVAAKMRELGNISPLISVEGLGAVSDERRGGERVYERTMKGIELCRKHRLIIGVATSVCKTNIKDLACEEYLNELIRRGVHYAWYYIYRPVGPDPAPELALSRDEIFELRKFIVDIRTKAPIIVVDAYWDHMGKALCPAAVGIANHIGPGGDIEPCPPVQFSLDNIGNGGNLYNTLNKSRFLKDFRAFASKATRGCILMEDPEKLKQFMEKEGAQDSSGRAKVFNELSCMTAMCSHDMTGHEIPEKSLAYRFAKKHWFFGFGAYG
jgi:MoaA/NifB/PqqE/SkfB family radical SAM enzyme